jgi:hypothetical protein
MIWWYLIKFWYLLSIRTWLLKLVIKFDCDISVQILIIFDNWNLQILNILKLHFDSWGRSFFGVERIFLKSAGLFLGEFEQPEIQRFWWGFHQDFVRFSRILLEKNGGPWGSPGWPLAGRCPGSPGWFSAWPWRGGSGHVTQSGTVALQGSQGPWDFSREPSKEVYL